MAGTVTIVEERTGSVKQIVFTWTSSTGAADGIATGQTTHVYCGEILSFVTNPDDTAAPTTNYDVEVLDEASIDVLHGAGANRASTGTEYVTASLGSVVNDKLRLNVTAAGSAKAGIVYVCVR